MSSSPHLVSLVLQSKKALQHGEQLCTEAQSLSGLCSKHAIDVLALDAKVRWINGGVVAQLELAKSVAESIEDKRSGLEKQVKEWDAWRVRHTDALDAALDSLGAQLVPPSFHQSTESDSSSLFGSQHSDDDEENRSRHHRQEPSSSPFHTSPTATLREEPRVNGNTTDRSDRSKWKTLRDFVDDRAIENSLEVIETERGALDDVLSSTEGYPETLSATINNILQSLPPVASSTPPESQTLPLDIAQITQILSAQDTVLTAMAHKLESLASHYEGMASALHEVEENNTEFSEEDLQDMNRDTNELPSIMGEMEESKSTIWGMQNQVLEAKNHANEQLAIYAGAINDLDELAVIMEEMVDKQDGVEVDTTARLATLRTHLTTLSHLHAHFISYENAFSRLLVELERRRSYGENMRAVINGMITELDILVTEEQTLRTQFTSEYGAHLPDDLCISVGNSPSAWMITPVNAVTTRAASFDFGSGEHESIPTVDADLLANAISRLRTAD